MDNCSRRRQWTKLENRKQCPQSVQFHPRLHKSNILKIRVTMATESKKAIFPVLSVNIGNADGLFKRGNALLDSGAQISLIRQELAETLGFTWKNASVTIAKVGIEGETIKTKGYKVQLSSFDDSSKRFTVEGNRHPKYQRRDRNSKYFAHTRPFPFSKRKISPWQGTCRPFDWNRSSQTKQFDNLLARKSPLGWVLFGRNPGGTGFFQTLFYELRESCSEKGIQRIFTTPAAPHQNGCAEALIKSSVKVR